MTFYLIDYENLQSGVTGFDTLSENDTVYCFYSKNANKLTFDLHKEIIQSKAKIEYFYIEIGGKNALDFQLSTYVGYLLAKFPEEKIYIVSKDTGFSKIVSFWDNFKEQQGRIELRANITEVSVESKNQNDEAIETEFKKHAERLKLTSEQQTEIIKIYNQFKTKQAINNNLNKYFKDSEKVREINKILKPFLKNNKK